MPRSLEATEITPQTMDFQVDIAPDTGEEERKDVMNRAKNTRHDKHEQGRDSNNAKEMLDWTCPEKTKQNK
ncbi:hypothetical protein ElyMa_004922700 [Elysia marginata]|uniref:Uncharacterized protein n=1 Tax=Elysia marginata TaxID=1093978 RepID=A0AAV4J0S3_9GAST|nr:hypothetical protein ElyMa_004922700 [Elysia marginata]